MLKKTNKRWLWTVMCRRTRQIIAFVIGDRSEATCCRLWNKVPMEYRRCISYSDFWDAYRKVLRRKRTKRLAKRADRRRTWSVGIARCANIRHGMFGKLFRFLSVMPFITWLPNGLSLTTILP